MLLSYNLINTMQFPTRIKKILKQLLIISSMMSLNLVTIWTSPFTLTYLIMMHKSQQ